jgi:rhomboid protease GluP
MSEASPWRPWVAYGLIAANLAAFAFELASGVDALSPRADHLVAVGGNLPALTLGGEPWRLLTAMFLHAGLMHLAMNMLCLYQLAFVERLLGRAGFAALYLAAGLGGGVLSAARTTATVSVGASGAVFGLVGALGAYLLTHRERISDEGFRRTARSLGTFLVINVIIGMSSKRIDMSAHLGGLVVGALAGLALTARSEEPRPARAVGVLALALALTAGALALLPRPAANTLLGLTDDTLGQLQTFHDVEHQTITRFNDLLREAKGSEAVAPTITPLQLADAIDNELVPPWRDVLGKLKVPSGNAEGAELVMRIRAYASARVRSWEQYTLALRDQDPVRQRAELDAYHAANTEATNRARDVAALLPKP